MCPLTLKVLGDLEVVRDGRPLPLPPSKKTRALLAYLALHSRSFSREHLCDLLWEVPDDPRGSLRWSLSKLRRLVDEPGAPRILADRLSVGLDTTELDIDVVALHRLVESGVADADLDALESAVQRYRGPFLEGLELANFPDFHGWCLAERERARRAQMTALTTLVDRLGEAPERALPHAHALVRFTPHDEAAWARLVRLLLALNRPREAEQHYRLGLRRLQEAGLAPSGTLWRARRHIPGAAVAAPTPPAREEPTPLADTDPPQALVGRESELARLAALVAPEGATQAGFLLLTGEPGIGKSRLLDAAAGFAREAGALVLSASAIESDRLRPFALWVDAFQRHDAVALFGMADHDNRNRLFGALAERLAAELDARPVVLLFDDLQWGDESSAAALHHVARLHRHRPLRGVLAARDGDLDSAPAQPALLGLRRAGLLEELSLPPLPEAALMRLIATQAPGVDCTRLSQQSGGNPLLAIELARSQTPGAGGSLDELVRERLMRLDTEALEVLRWAAVIAPRLDAALLARATGLDAIRVGEALAAAERLRLLQTTERGLHFTHDLVAKSVYRSILPARRQVMHRHLAEHLAQETLLDLEYAADLAHHAQHSGDPALAAQAMVAAGRLCLRFFANDEAVRLAERGLALAEELPEARRLCLTLELHDVLLSAAPLDDWEATAGELVVLAERALEHGALAHARLGYQLASQLRWAHGQWSGAHEEALQAERVTRSADDHEQVIAMAETAKCLAMLERDLEQASTMLAEARTLAERQRLSHPALPMASGLLAWHAGHAPAAEADFKAARTLCKAYGDRLGEFQANESLMMMAVERGDFTAARARCDTLVALGERLRDGSEAPFAQAAHGLCHYALSDDATPLAEALGALREADAKHRLAWVLNRAARLDLQRGRIDAAVPRAEEALDHARVLERATEQLVAHRVLAEAYRAQGDTAAQRHHANAAAALAGHVACWAETPLGETAAGATPGAAP
ncbi:hypothetical protein EQG41_07820 [Billgrantia azerbaijanica]|nr:hypothetical protein EQG41_07820 [Halomonas azerbaijanica]